MSPIIVGLLGFAVLLLLIFLHLPIGFAMALVGFAGIAYLTSIETALGNIGSQVFGTIHSYDMAVVALFILMGELAFNAGISGAAYRAAFKWLGHLRGGLAMATVVACGAFAAVTGSSPATAATMGGIALPEMKKYGYDDSLATGSVAAGGTLGILIPPSAGLILYGILTEQSIGDLFIAGILPGVVLVILFVATVYVVVKLKPGAASSAPPSSLREKLASLSGFGEVAVLFILVIGGLIAGYFTPTEAGGVGAIGVLVIGLVKRNLNLEKLSHAVKQATRMAAMILIILVGAMVFTRFLALSTLPFRLGELVGQLPLPPTGILAMVLLTWLVLACVMDAIAMIVLTVPIFFPLISALGFDPIWFGIITVMMIEMGLITPPIGLNVYIINGVAKDVPMHVIFRGVVPYLIAMVIGLIMVVVFPQIALFLPGIT
ncbi:MAG: TRAP transporter large permease [Dehalococcoidia bacterium]